MARSRSTTTCAAARCSGGVDDAVNAGTRLGREGNSGNTSEPHLHLQVQPTDSLDPAEATSLPMSFSDISVNTAHVALGELPGRGVVRQL